MLRNGIDGEDRLRTSGGEDAHGLFCEKLDA
jgi:hypothetical protein